MNVANKIKAFEQMALKAAEEKRRSSASAMEIKFQSSVNEQLRDDERYNRERLQNEQYKIERDKNKHIVDISSKAKREFISRRESLTSMLFGEIENDLRAFVSSPGYAEYLTGKIKDAASQGSYEFVQLTKSDMRFAEEISKATSLTAEEARDDFIGGFRLIGKGRRAVSDHTFSGRLAGQRNGFSLLIKEGKN